MDGKRDSADHHNPSIAPVANVLITPNQHANTASQENNQQNYELRKDNRMVKELSEFLLVVPFLRSFIRPNNVTIRCLSSGIAVICLLDVRSVSGGSQLHLLHNTSLTLPFVTICTNARINATKSRNLGVSPQLLAYLLSTYKGFYLFYNDRNSKLRNQTESLQLQYKEFFRNLRSVGDESIGLDGDLDLSKFFIDHGFECKQFIKACMVQGVLFDCCAEANAFLSEKGKCFNLRSPLFTHQSIPGSSGGMRIYVRNHEEEYPEAFINDYPDSGVQVHLNWPEDGHSITTDRCYSECLLRLMFKTCTCFQLGLVAEAEKRDPHFVCDPLRATTCVQPLMQATNMGFLWDMYDVTQHCNCPVRCNEWKINPQVSYSALPNAGYILEWMRVVDKALDRRSGEPGSGSSPLMDDIVIDVYYSSFDYKSVTPTRSVPIPSQLLSIALAASVCIGMDLITFLQFTFLSIMSILAKFKWKKIYEFVFLK